MSEYRYQLEKYRGPRTRHVCPQCHRKQSFTRYIDTHNNNEYINDNVGKCNRLDKCGYHYTPKQYFEDNPWTRSVQRPVVHYDRENGRLDDGRSRSNPQPRRIDYIPEEYWVRSRFNGVLPDHVRWLVTQYGVDAVQEVYDLYGIGASKQGETIFWQRDIEGRLRTGKIMAYDSDTGHRRKGEGAIRWVHSELKRTGRLDDKWQLTQCLYGEHILADNPDMMVAVVEAYKTAHVGAIVMPWMVWVAVDSMSGLTAERLRPLKGRDVVLFPDEGKGYQMWSEKIAAIAAEVGFSYRVSSFMEGREQGADIADLR